MTKNKVMKRMTALAAASLMLIGLVIPVSAAPAQKDTGTITVHKYTGSGNGIEVNPNQYTGEIIDPSDSNHPSQNGYTPLENAGFTLYSVDMSGVKTAIENGNKITGYTVSGTTVSFTLDGEGTPAVTTGSGTMGEYIAEQFTGVNGETVFGNSDIPDGYYVLVETTTPEGHIGANPSFIRMPLTKGSGEDYNYDVHVYPKNKNTSDQTVKDIGDGVTPVSQGDIVPFEISAKFLNTQDEPDRVTSVNDLRAGEPGAYTYGTALIKDILDDTFEYEQSSLNVYWLDNSGNIDIAGGALPTEYYSVTNPAAGGGGELLVSLSNAGIDAAIDGGKAGFAITFNAEFSGLPEGNSGSISKPVVNTAQSTITKAGSTDEPEPEVEIEIPSLELKINKFTSDGTTPLAEVEFVLAKVATPNYKYSSLTTASEWSDVSTADQEQYVLGSDGLPLTAKTDASGNIIFSQLPGYQNESGVVFYIIETQVPAGYDLPVTAVEVTYDTKDGYLISHPEWFDGNENWTKDVRVNETATILNYKHDEPKPDPTFSLPLTGGTGTIAFTLLGILIMAVAALFFIKSRRKDI